MTLCCPICKSKIVVGPDGKTRSCDCKGRVWGPSYYSRSTEAKILAGGFWVVKAVDCKDLQLGW